VSTPEDKSGMTSKHPNKASLTVDSDAIEDEIHPSGHLQKPGMPVRYHLQQNIFLWLSSVSKKSAEGWKG